MYAQIANCMKKKIIQNTRFEIDRMTKYQQIDWQHFTLVILCHKFWIFRLFRSSEHIPLIEMENLCALYHKALTDTHTHLYTNNIKSVYSFIPCIIAPYNGHEPRDILNFSKKKKKSIIWFQWFFFLAFSFFLLRINHRFQNIFLNCWSSFNRILSLGYILWIRNA